MIGRRGGVAVIAVLMVDSLAIGLFVPLSLLYLVAASGASLSTVGVLLGLAGVLSLPVPLWVGRWVDRVGARPIVLTAQIVQAAGAAAYLLVVEPGLVFVAALVASIGQRLYTSSIFTLVSDLSEGDSDPRARERWLGRIAALRAAGYGVGALVSGAVLTARSQSASRAVVLAITALLLVAAVVVATAVPRATRSSNAAVDDARGYRRLWKDRPYLALIGLNTAFGLCNLMLGVAFPPYVVRALPALAWAVGPLLVLNTVVQAAAQTTVVRFLRRLPRHVALAGAGGLWAAWSALTAAALAVTAGLRAQCLLVAVLCYAAAQLCHGPVSNALSADAAPAELLGRYLAAFQYSFALAGVAAPPLFSLLTGVTAALPWLALTALAASTVPATLLLARRLPKAALTGRTQA